MSGDAWWAVAWACGDRWLMSAYRSAGQGGVVIVRFDLDAVLDGSCVDDGARNALEELGERVDVVAGWPGGGGHCWVVLDNTTNPARFRRVVTRYFTSLLAQSGSTSVGFLCIAIENVTYP